MGRFYAEQLHWKTGRSDSITAYSCRVLRANWRKLAQESAECPDGKLGMASGASPGAHFPFAAHIGKWLLRVALLVET